MTRARPDCPGPPAGGSLTAFMSEETTDGVPFSGAPTADAGDSRPTVSPVTLPREIGGFPILGKLGEGGWESSTRLSGRARCGASR